MDVTIQSLPKQTSSRGPMYTGPWRSNQIASHVHKTERDRNDVFTGEN